MKKIRFICIATAAVIAASCAVPSLAAEKFGDKSKTVYSVTFDDGSDKYTLEGGASLTDGADGKAVRLDGEKQQYVKLKNDITEKLEGDYTISVDFLPEADTSFARVFDLGSGTDNFAYFTANGGGIPKFRFKNDDLYSDGVLFKVGEWNNATITKEGTNAKLYVNGEIAATSTTFMNSLSLLSKTDKNYLGKSQYEQDAYFTGMIDNFTIYSYAIPEGEIKMALTDGEVQVKAGYRNNGDEVIFFNQYAENNLTAYANIKNYKKADINARLVNVVYNADNSVRFITNSDTFTIPSGESFELTNTVKIPATDLADAFNSKDFAEKVNTYIYTTIGGFEKIASISPSLLFYSAPLPEDTMETTIGVHDPSIFKDPKSGTYYVYSTGMIDIYKSEDLVNWTKTVGTLPELPQCVYDMYKHDKKEEYSNIWAPDMFYDEDDKETPYHLTCSYSDAFGKNNSSIILFKSASPDGPWKNGQIIFASKSDDPELGKVNAIDSNICVDHETGQKYMVYGSFWQGIHIKELNDDGTLKDPDTVGTRIMSRYRGIGGPEGPYIVYNEETGYYYLFTSYDSLSETYNIRVARSKNITGPYVDAQGNSVDRFDDDESESKNTYGYKLMGSYQFPNGKTNYGPGHNSVLNDNGRWYLVHHIREVKNGYATLNVREMTWNDDGWPVVTPERYQGIYFNTLSCLAGEWDFISIGDNTNSKLASQKLVLTSGYYPSSGKARLGNITGTWSLTDWGNEFRNKLTIKLGDDVIIAYVKKAWDSDNNCPTITFTGTDQNNVAKWGRKAISSVVYK